MKRTLIRKQPEAAEQRCVIRYANLFWWKDLLFAIPNGAYLAGTNHYRLVRGYQLKLLGLKPGIPDLFLAYPRPGFHGLFIEMKASPDYQSTIRKGQKHYQNRLNEVGFKTVICKGADDAIKVFKDYFAEELNARGAINESA